MSQPGGGNLDFWLMGDRVEATDATRLAGHNAAEQCGSQRTTPLARGAEVGAKPVVGFRPSLCRLRGRRRRDGVVVSVALLLLLLVVPSVSAASGSGLPDHRAYELVSALVSGEPAGSGEPYLPPSPVLEGLRSPFLSTKLPFAVAATGEAVAYVGEPGVATGTGETGPGDGNEWIAHRTSTGWHPEDVTPNDTSKEGENAVAEYESFFTPESTDSIYEGDTVPLVPAVERGCAVLYALEEGAVFKPLYNAGDVREECGHPQFAGTTNDGSQVIFQSEAALTPESENATNADLPPEHETHSFFNRGEGCLVGCNLYDVVDGHVRSVNVLGGKPVPSANFGGFAPGKGQAPNFSNAISTDGSRIFWTDTEGGISTVYVLEDGTTTERVSGPEPAEYWSASPDGRYAFYTEGGSLWRFDTEENTSHRLTPEGSEVLGVIGTNQSGEDEDGAYLYFVANAELTTAANARGEKAVLGSCPASGETCNLYLLHNKETTFIARLSSSDDELSAAQQTSAADTGDWHASLGGRVAELTPDGRALVFQSIRELTGPRNESGPPQPAVYVYSAETGELDCASCSPTLASYSSESETLFSKLPESGEAETYSPTYISEDGTRVFFDDERPLTGQAINGIQNVYEWERPATSGDNNDTCSSQEASPATGGCTFLLSGGESELDSFLIGAGSTGNDVFFEHTGSLGGVEAPADDNEIYDARVNGGFPQVALGCLTESCPPTAAPPSAPVYAPTITFSGIGNFQPAAPSKTPRITSTRESKLDAALKSCRRAKSKTKRRRCERLAKKMSGHATAIQSLPRATSSIGRKGHS
jgi:hypothetical protein